MVVLVCVGFFCLSALLRYAQDIPLAELKSLLAPEYTLYQLFMNPEDVGHAGARRHRTYIYCCHQHKCEYLWDVYEVQTAVSEAISQNVATTPSDYRISCQQARRVDLMNFSRKRKRADYDPAAWAQEIASGLVGSLEPGCVLG